MTVERSLGLEIALASIGGVRKLARLVNRTSATIAVWKHIPVEHVLTIEQAIKIPRSILRPDIYPPGDEQPTLIEEIEEMKRYRVTWTVELNANGPRTAAMAAQDIQRDVRNTATIYEVSGEGGVWHIDLADLPSGHFREHACWKCKNGERPCVNGDARKCNFPHLRVD